MVDRSHVPNDNEALRYPIGRYLPVATLSTEERAICLDVMAAAPSALRAAVAGLSDAQLDTVYRAGGWTLRQVVHHMADDHMNSYIRCRLALTEDAPTIKGYFEAAWADLADARQLPVAPSLDLLESLHKRWVYLLRGLSPDDLKRPFFHPERATAITVDALISLYSWHSRHHVAHITTMRDRSGW